MIFANHFKRVECSYSRFINLTETAGLVARMVCRRFSVRVSYSEESKVKAVRLYWKLDSYSHTVDQLGYPSLHILRTWVKTRTRHGSLYKRADKRARTVHSTYTAQLRLQVVQAVLDKGLTVAQAAHRFHVVNKEIIYRWIKCINALNL